MNEHSWRELVGEERSVGFDQVAIGIASSDTMRSWSKGEVKNPETINYRTFKPEKGGLFCERIFGPTRDWECSCGKYKRIKHKGVICDRCGVEVTLARVRRERMGHIELAVPVSHIWFYKCMPSRIGLMLDMSARQLERVIYYEDYIVIDPGKTPLQKAQLLNEIEYREAQEQYGEDFVAGMGAEAVKRLLSEIELNKLNKGLEKAMGATKSKQIRQNLLGKRVDYSGRSVIVIGPELKLHQCGLPKKMALVLFEPFIIRRLKDLGYVHTVRSAKKMIERQTPEVWDILDEVTRGHPVLLNRAPTLHRLSIQAFEPQLIEGEAIRIHPLVCTAYNADFDGDQMAVHVPLSVEAQLEARMLMLAPNNIFSPSSGKPITTPSQDITLGCYYLTQNPRGPSKDGQRLPLFADAAEVEFAMAEGSVCTHDHIRIKNPDFGRKTIYGSAEAKTIETTPGRVIFNEIWPSQLGFFNKPAGKKQLSDIIWRCYQIAGPAETVATLDKLKELGFTEATKAGISIGISDMIIPKEKQTELENAYKQIRQVEQQYRRGIITDGERYNKIIDIWTHAGDEISNIMFRTLEHNEGRKELNPVYLMVDSGARGNRQQVRQLAGMRGLMAKPSGEIIERPITSNFREGLSVLEYFISTHGARKGLADTALRTADSGYLTRRLVDVSQDVIIREEDCGTERGVIMPIGTVIDGQLTRDPHVATGVEARVPKGKAPIAELAGTVRIEDTEQYRKLTITPDDGSDDVVYDKLSRRSRLRVEDGQHVEVGEQLTEGAVDPHEVLRIMGPREVQLHLVREVQEVYRSQGVSIHDKHIEVIIRQMLKRVTIIDSGATEFLPGALVERTLFETENRRVAAEGGEPASARPVLMGITKASLATESWLSAASFQETTKVLTDAAIQGKSDSLLGLKENVIIGKLIPAGTGISRYRNITVEPTEEARAAVYTMAGYDDGQYYSPDVFGQGTGEAVRLEEYDWRG